MKKYDVVIIGAGPGGYVSAIRCAQLGLSTACVESWINDEGKPALGGTCLNVGCIPSKALLDSSHHFAHIKNQSNVHGINVTGVSMDVNKMVSRKAKIVKTLTQGINGLFKKNKIDWLRGQAKIISNKEIEISPTNEAHDEKTVVLANHIIIATGSVPTKIPSASIDNKFIVDSTGALKFNEVPRRLGVIGAGVIGLELGSVWNRLGSEVIVLEALPNFLSLVDHQVAKEAEKSLREQGLDIRLGAKVTGTGSNNREVTINYDDVEGKQQITVDKLIVAVGRSPNTAGLGADECGLELDQRGFITVDDHCNTSLKNIYAIGDVIDKGPMLAHKAEDEGIAVAEIIAGQAGHVNYDVIPAVIYTSPEVAMVGKTEEQLNKENIKYKIGKFPFLANSRAKVNSENEGFVKIIAEEKTDKVLGVSIIGTLAGTMIAELALAMEFGASAEDIARTCHAHPTHTEAVKEAAMAVDKRPIHF